MEYALKNTKEAQKHNKNNSQEAANMLGQKEKFSESLNTAAELLETTIETWKNMLKTFEKYEKQNMKIPESDFVAYKVMSITKKITSSFPLVIASFGASVVSTEYRIKFLKEIMKDKMFVVPASFVPYNDTVTLLTYKRLRNLDLDIDVFCFKGKTKCQQTSYN